MLLFKNPFFRTRRSVFFIKISRNFVVLQIHSVSHLTCSLNQIATSMNFWVLQEACLKIDSHVSSRMQNPYLRKILGNFVNLTSIHEKVDGFFDHPSNQPTFSTFLLSLLKPVKLVIFSLLKGGQNFFFSISLLSRYLTCHLNCDFNERLNYAWHNHLQQLQMEEASLKNILLLMAR